MCLLPLNNRVRKFNVFSHVCLSLCSQGEVPMWPLPVIQLVSHLGPPAYSNLFTWESPPAPAPAPYPHGPQSSPPQNAQTSSLGSPHVQDPSSNLFTWGPRSTTGADIWWLVTETRTWASERYASYLNDILFVITARKCSLRRLCFYTCLSFILFTGGGGIPACNGPTVYKQLH